MLTVALYGKLIIMLTAVANKLKVSMTLAQVTDHYESRGSPDSCLPDGDSDSGLPACGSTTSDAFSSSLVIRGKRNMDDHTGPLWPGLKSVFITSTQL